jgi:hypothetical protein
MEGQPQGGFADVPTGYGVYPPELYTYHATEGPGYQLVAVHLMPATYDPVRDQAVLRRRLDVTVRYTVAHPFVLADVRPWCTLCPAGEPLTLWASATNVGDSSAVLTPWLTLYDALGSQVGSWPGVPVAVPAGASLEVGITSGVVLPEGEYLAQLALQYEGSTVAEGPVAVTVLPCQLTDLAGPRSLSPGATGTFHATFRNLLGHSTEVDITLEVLDEHGHAIASQQQAVTATAGADATVPFTWTSNLQHTGHFTVRAWADATGHRYGPMSRPLDVLPQNRLYLPVVVKG